MLYVTQTQTLEVEYRADFKGSCQVSFALENACTIRRVAFFSQNCSCICLYHIYTYVDYMDSSTCDVFVARSIAIFGVAVYTKHSILFCHFFIRMFSFSLHKINTSSIEQY